MSAALGVAAPVVPAPVLVDLRRDMDIERLLTWAYRDQLADLVIDRGDGLMEAEASADGVEVQGVSGDGVIAALRQAWLGCRVDGGGASAGHLHVDAEAVHRAVTALSRPIAGMVIRHARAATRPDWLPGAVPKAEPRMNGRGRVLVRHDPWDQHRNYGWCPVDWTVSLVQIKSARDEWTLWRDALVLLAMALAQPRKLRRHRPLLPGVPAQPWLEQRVDAKGVDITKTA